MSLNSPLLSAHVPDSTFFSAPAAVSIDQSQARGISVQPTAPRWVRCPSTLLPRLLLNYSRITMLKWRFRQWLIHESPDALQDDKRRRRVNKRIWNQQTGEHKKATETSLNALQVRARNLRHERMVCTYIITPEAFHASRIRRLPDDILTEIFKLAGAMPGQAIRVGTGVKWVLIQVCWRWRSVVCTYPLFWSCFAVTLSGKGGSVDILRVHLERCKGAPVSAAVIDDLVDDQFEIPMMKIQVLGEHAEQIDDLRLLGAGTFFRSRPSLVVFKDRLLCLEVLELECDIPPDVFLHAPRLRTLILPSSIELLYIKHKLPLGQIQSVKFRTSTSGFNLGPLRENLTSMVSFQKRDSRPIGVPGSPPPLASLRSWRVNFGEPRQPAFGLQLELLPFQHPSYFFFSRFRTPALRELYAKYLPRVEGLLDLLQNSACMLTSLVLKKPRIYTNELMRLLESVPGLQTLKIISGPCDILTDEFFSTLVVRTDSNHRNLLPVLIELFVEGEYQFSTSFLLAMLESRTCSSVPVMMRLERVDISLEDRTITADDVYFLTDIQHCTVRISTIGAWIST
ncbi:hypothetical protein R3P38DRAFT_2843785 [Favolaschia claudopus]|uniref:F-box domain-containing protein n=1 Tax=Favolaschia claudopus TaxID=2862362 RepID=A0AAW0E2J2_9AGAR